jgi:hypothetical protein
VPSAPHADIISEVTVSAVPDHATTAHFTLSSLVVADTLAWKDKVTFPPIAS